MDFIKRKAKDFTDEHLMGGIASVQQLVNEAKEIISGFDNHLDKVKFLNLILEKNNYDYSEHLKVCKSKEDCSSNFSHESVAYYLSQELYRLGVQINNDTFTEGDRKEAESKIDQILKDLNDIKVGQQVLFAELNEMKDLFFLGKKKWYQLLIGKSIDMTASGIVSETVSKQIIEVAKKHIPTLLGH
jgi:hypothetical protein